ncbi:uncharacterized protein BT62DRAFT_896251 [Guyanagaster necrorhizus]|uniref:Secreted protein n=1 Tax=Guyanagaster necrorhizus TaxID=856835 RepID=A0A9P7VSI3_9AGAR|nr:uncharacterized protein BT62DRAFT_896251 [Guyanagaster necrorhizus MCA 3950]KAG7445665.1 hypothetical protein BT62DRAFT_896251 [Guyanagaster necrorhizus MCA 3950]
MCLSAIGYLLAILALRVAAWQSLEAYIVAVNKFGAECVSDPRGNSTLTTLCISFVNPAPIVAQGNASTLADNVVGRIDITTNFVGQELNIEYLYGLFLEGATANTTQLIGTPITTVPQALVVEQPVAFVSFVTNLLFSTVNLTLPLQIDVILRFDDETMKVTSYDATLRRWSEFWDYYIPLLVPKAAEELMAANTADVDYCNSTDIIVHRAAADICTVAQTYCLGGNQQYDSYDQCVQFITEEVPFGASWSGGENASDLAYRWKDIDMVKYRPDVHCPHVGPTGGDYCIPRNYIDIVLNPPFNESFIAYTASGQ